MADPSWDSNPCPRCPTTSVIIPVYNTAAYLAACLDSVFAQTQDAFEVICVDDGSTDGSLDVLGAYAAQHPNMTVLEQDHAMQGAARNRGLAMARGEYVYFLDSDDCMRPDLIERCTATCEDLDLDFVTFDSESIFEPPLTAQDGGMPDRSDAVEALSVETGRRFWHRYHKLGCVYNPVLHFMRRDFLLENGLVFREGICFEDNDWAARLYLAAQRMTYLPDKLYTRRYRAGSVTRSAFDPLKVSSLFDEFAAALDLIDEKPDHESVSIADDLIDIVKSHIRHLFEAPVSPALDRALAEGCAGTLRSLQSRSRSATAQIRQLDFARMIEACSGEALEQAGPVLADIRSLERVCTIEAIASSELADENAHVGIYGSGIIARRFLERYRLFVGEPRAQIAVLDSEKTEGISLGYRILNIAALEVADLDLIVVASTRYLEDMLAAAHEHASSRARIVAVAEFLREPVKTSVIIPVYNTAAYLAACLDSVFAQTQDAFEVICVDDGSTDGSLDVLGAYAAQHPNMTVLEQDHAMQGAARNRGLAAARGEYVYFLDSDDIMEPQLLETCHATCEEFGLDVVAFDSQAFEDRGGTMHLVDHPAIHDRTTSGLDGMTMTGVEFWKKAFPAGYMSSVCWLTYQRRDFLLANHLLFEEGIFYEDNDWIARLHICARSMRYLPVILHHYRVHQSSTMEHPCTPEKIRSRMRVHDVLCELYRTYPDEDERYPIVCEFLLSAYRMRTFGETNLSSACLDELRAFAGKLRDRLAQNNSCESTPERDLSNIDRAMLRCVLWAIRPEGDKASEAPLVPDNDLLFEYERALAVPDISVAIFGTGMRARKALSAMRTVDLPICANLMFLNSHPSDGQTFEGYPVRAVADISDTLYDRVFIASRHSGEEMASILRSIAGDVIPTSLIPWQVEMAAEGCR